MWAKGLARNRWKTPLAIGEQIKAGFEDLLKVLGAIPTAIEHDRHAPISDEKSGLLKDAREHFNQAGVGLGGDDEQGIASLIVDPVVGSRRHRQAHLSDMGFWQPMFAVVNPDVAVDIKEADGVAAQSDSPLGQCATELGGPFARGQLGQLSAQGFDFGCTIQSQHTTEILRRVLLEGLGPFNSPQCHQEQRQ